nr:hypothetical protein [uncultured Actinomyces sp.]
MSAIDEAVAGCSGRGLVCCVDARGGAACGVRATASALVVRT